MNILMSEHTNLVCFKEVNSLKYTSQCSLTQELNTLNCVVSSLAGWVLFPKWCSSNTPAMLPFQIYHF